MDVDFWTSTRVHSVKHQSGPAAPHFNSADKEEEARAFFPCPFCYVEIELPVFCAHLQEEHCFDLRNAVYELYPTDSIVFQICPLCAENLGRNPLEHFTLQHTHSIKRRLKSQRSGGVWVTNQPGPGKEPRDISSYLGTASRNSTRPDSVADPLLAPFLSHAPQSRSINLQEDERFKISSISTRSDEKRITGRSVDESQRQDGEEKRQMIVFVEDLVMSTIF